MFFDDNNNNDKNNNKDISKELYMKKMQILKDKINKKNLSKEEELIYKTLPYSNGKREHRSTHPILTNYEYTNIIGTRAEQIDRGAKPFINPCIYLNPILTSIDIAKQEFRQGLLDYKIKRPYPDGTYEEWYIREMIWMEDYGC